MARSSSGSPSAASQCLDNSDDTMEKRKVTFLSLPAEIRLRIYDILLVSRVYPGDPTWAVENSDPKMVEVKLVRGYLLSAPV
jgi:hypothetical protein